MKHIETNIYPITNLEELNCKYRVYKVRGLSPDTDEYHRNTNLLISQLSYRTKSPCHFLETEEGSFIAQPEGFPELPESFDLIRTPVKIELQPDLQQLQFDSKDPDDLAIIQRFLQFSLQNPLYNNPALWQPRAGFPYYHKSPDKEFQSLSKRVDLYKGFTFRVAFCDGTIGICVDTSNKYAARKPLPTTIDRNEFKNYKGLNCLYEYGNDWYEIKIDALSDFTASELMLPDGTTLYDNVHQRSGPKKSPLLLSLPKDCSVLMYRTQTGQTRNVPSGLCRLTFTTDHPEIRDFHAQTLKHPSRRRSEIHFVVDQYLRKLTFGPTKIKLSTNALSSTPNRVPIPDLRFGNITTLSLKKQDRAVSVSLFDHARKKKELLYAHGAYKKKPLDSQYFIMPQSVFNTYGNSFLTDLKNDVDRLLAKPAYEPVLIPYDDSIQKSVYNVARAITDAVDQSDLRPGFAVVMVPTIRSKIIKEDELANIIMQKLREKDLYASVIHTAVPGESYEYTHNENGEETWLMTKENKQRSRIKGYLQGVAINKVLLLNSVWPFVLQTPLSADLTIGIDVKNRVAGFTFVYKTGADIRFFDSESHDKEQLSRKHLKARISQFLAEEKEMLKKHHVQNIVIHRQGRLFPGEIQGIREALTDCARKKLLPKDYGCTFCELKKTSRVPFRLFHVKTVTESQGKTVQNPMVGTYYRFGINNNEAFLCNTGVPYRHRGTTKPIHVAKIDGPMQMEDIIRDVFFLANLTWTKIDDCSRDPLTIKMADIKLREVAGYYDADAYDFSEDETGGEEDE